MSKELETNVTKSDLAPIADSTPNLEAIDPIAYAELLQWADERCAEIDINSLSLELPVEPNWGAAGVREVPVRSRKPATLTSKLLPTKYESEGALDVALGFIDDAKRAANATKTFAQNVSEQIEIPNIPLSARQAVALTVASGVLIGGVASNNQPNPQNGVDLDKTEHDLNIDGVKIRYTDSSTEVTLPVLEDENQDPTISAGDVVKATGIPEDEVNVIKDKLVLPRNVTEQDVVSAIISASAPDLQEAATTTTIATTTTQPPSAELPKPGESASDSEYIDWLANSVHVTAEEYKTFDVDTSRVGVFNDELSGKKITPTAFVGHWTAGVYENGVDQFVSAIKNREGNCCSVMYFMDKDAKVYRFVASWEQTAHAKGANEYSQGVEIEARDLRDYTPDQMAAFIKLGYRFMTANDIPIERKNFIGHMELGTGKIDMPPELVDKLFVKLQELDNEIKNGGSPDLPSTGSEMTYDEAMNELLAEIRQHEGDYDAINRGEAGDTKTYSDAYYQTLGGRKLTELTIKEILDLHITVGGYQFIHPTFSSAVQSTGIDVNRTFDINTQNELAVNYLLLGGKRKTLTAYLKGESDDIDGAAQDMCKEWASIPCADGKIYPAYNVSGNAAKGGVERYQHIRQLLINIRTAHDQKNNPQPTPEIPNVNNKVVLIGDSLTVGYNKFGKISEVDEYAGLDITVSDGVGGRPLVGGEDDGVHAVEQHIGEISQAGSVIIGLGTNAPEDDDIYKSEMEKVIARIHSPEVNPTANIMLISGFSYVDGTKSAERRNRRAKMLDEIAEKYPNVYVLDVANVISSDMFADDNVHLSGEGYKKVTAEILNRTAEILHTNPVQTSLAAPVTTTVPSTTTTVTTTITDEKLPTVPENDFSWFSEEQARHIYEPYFRNSDGSIDTARLDEWMVSLEKAADAEGTVKYHVSIDKTPDQAKEGEK